MMRFWITIFVSVLVGVSAGCGLAADGSAEPRTNGTKPTVSVDQASSRASAGPSKSPLENDEAPLDGECDDIGSDSSACATLTRNDRPVPNVVGLRVLAACEALLKGGYEGGVVVGEVVADEKGPGRVVSQDPRAGGKGTLEAPVELVVSEPFPAEKLHRNPDCQDATQYGPGGKSNKFPNGKPNRAKRR